MLMEIYLVLTVEYNQEQKLYREWYNIVQLVYSLQQVITLL